MVMVWLSATAFAEAKMATHAVSTIFQKSNRIIARILFTNNKPVKERPKRQKTGCKRIHRLQPLMEADDLMLNQPEKPHRWVGDRHRERIKPQGAGHNILPVRSGQIGCALQVDRRVADPRQVDVATRQRDGI